MSSTHLLADFYCHSENLRDKLGFFGRKQLGGYDISAYVMNMFLHRYMTPQIHEYNTITSEDYDLELSRQDLRLSRVVSCIKNRESENKKEILKSSDLNLSRKRKV